MAQADSGSGTAEVAVPDPMLQLRHVDKEFEIDGATFVALSDVTTEIGSGEFCSIIGPSGCGKSTLLRIMASILPATRGQVTVAGLDADEARRQRMFGFVFQEPVLLPWRSAEANIALPMQMAGIKAAERRDRARSLLELVGLSGFEAARPAELSGGMARRVAIARALALEPRILLLDEPFQGLDEIRRQRMNVELQRIWGESGTTALLVTHNVGEAVFLSDRVIVMGTRPGRIVGALEIKLPRPRPLELLQDQEFFEYERGLTQLLQSTYEDEV